MLKCQQYLGSYNPLYSVTIPSKHRHLDLILYAMLLSIIVVIISACDESIQDEPVPETEIAKFSGVDVLEPVQSALDDRSRTRLVTESARESGTLVIDTFSCGIPDPAIDAATLSKASKGSLELNLVSEIHAGLMMITENEEIGLSTALADNYSVTDDGLTYEFTLKKGLKFSDGSPLRASDVKWSWERSLRKSVWDGRAVYALGAIEGAGAVANAYSSDLIGVEVVDDRHLIVRLQEPRPEFLTLLADPVASVLKRENTERWNDVWVNDSTGAVVNTGRELGELPVGAGPFKLTEYVKIEATIDSLAGETRCVLKRNEHFWDRVSHLDGIIARVYPDLWRYSGTSVRQLENILAGDLDIGIADAGVKHDTQAMSDGPNIRRMRAAPWTEFIVLNPAHAPFDNRQFRVALARSAGVEFDAEELNRIVPESVAPFGSNVSGYQFDAKGAKEDWEDSLENAPGDEVETFYYVYVFDFLLDHVDSVFQSWKTVLDFDVEVREYEFIENENGEDVLSPPLENLHLASVHTSLDYPLPQQALEAVVNAFGSERLPKELAEIKQLLSDAATEPDNAVRQRKYEQIEQHMLDEALVIPLGIYEPHVDFLVQAWVHDLNHTKYSGSTFHKVWMDKTAPERTLPQ